MKASAVATAVMEAFGEFQVGDRVLLRLAPDHVGYAGTIESLHHQGVMCQAVVMCDAESKAGAIGLAAALAELELL